MGYSNDQVQNFVIAAFKSGVYTSLKKKNIEPEIYTILDERSDSDSTVVVTHRVARIETIEPGEMRGAERERHDEELDRFDGGPRRV